jgi:hypothetical protein
MLRWLLTLPSAAAGFLLVFWADVSLHDRLQQHCQQLNPYDPGPYESACTGYWQLLSLGVLSLGVAIAAIGVVLLPTLMAPGHKHWVAALFYCLGAVVALLITVFTKAALFLLVALVAGGITYWLLWRRYTWQEQHGTP